MDNFWENFVLELALLSFLGVLYYFYQKKKIIHYEENKGPLIMGFILQSCLLEKKDSPEPELDSVIEALDDYLQNKSTTPPLALLQHYLSSGRSSPELSDVIREGLLELEAHDDSQK